MSHMSFEYDFNDQILIGCFFYYRIAKYAYGVRHRTEKKSMITQRATLDSIRRRYIMHRNGSSRSSGFNHTLLPHEP